MYDSWFGKMSHDTTGSIIWFIILLCSLRGVYANAVKKDYGFAAAFAVIFAFSLYMTAVSLGALPPGIEEELFK